MPASMVREIYQVAAQELSEVPALPMEELFNNGVVQYRVGTIISDAAAGKSDDANFLVPPHIDPEVRLVPSWSGAIWRCLTRAA